MSKTPPTTDNPPATNTAADQARQEAAAQLKRYCERFGAEKGAAYYLANMPYEEALEKALTETREQITKLTAAHQAERDELAQKLQAATKLNQQGAGEHAPVKPGQETPPATHNPAGTKPGASKFIRMPTATAQA